MSRAAAIWAKARPLGCGVAHPRRNFAWRILPYFVELRDRGALTCPVAHKLPYMSSCCFLRVDLSLKFYLRGGDKGVSHSHSHSALEQRAAEAAAKSRGATAGRFARPIELRSPDVLGGPVRSCSANRLSGPARRQRVTPGQPRRAYQPNAPGTQATFIC
jgi:hypothetical protein